MGNRLYFELEKSIEINRMGEEVGSPSYNWKVYDDYHSFTNGYCTSFDSEEFQRIMNLNAQEIVNLILEYHSEEFADTLLYNESIYICGEWFQVNNKFQVLDDNDQPMYPDIWRQTIDIMGLEEEEAEDG